MLFFLPYHKNFNHKTHVAGAIYDLLLGFVSPKKCIMSEGCSLFTLKINLGIFLRGNFHCLKAQIFNISVERTKMCLLLVGPPPL